MEINYVKARLYLTKFNENIGDEESVLVNNKFIETIRERGLGDLKQILNNHLLNYALDKTAFAYSQVLRLEDLQEYSDLGFVHSILPIHISLEMDKCLNGDYNDFLTKEIPIYIYFKIQADDIDNPANTKALLDEISGQLTDGWGEGFEQKTLDLSHWAYNKNTNEYEYISDTGYSLTTFSFKKPLDIQLVTEIKD